MLTHFRVLGTGISLTAPAPVADPVVAAYRRFRVDQPVPHSVPIRLETAPRSTLQVAERQLPLVEGIDLTLQLYHHFLLTLFDRIDSCAMVHAAALTDREGNAFLLVGPSGHGKSSLALELARRGRRFLTDDYAPFDLANGTILPYPRAVGVVPGGRGTIPDSVQAAADRPDTPRLFGKSLIDLGEVLGEDRVAHEPAPLRKVFVLEAGAETSAAAEHDRTQIVVREISRTRIEKELEAVHGVQILQSVPRGSTHAFELRMQPDVPLDRRLSTILCDDDVVFSCQLSARRPRFARSVGLAPILRREAATAMCREMLNRRESGRLLSRFGGDPCELLLEMSAALRHADCTRLTIGSFADTADRIEELT